MSGKSSSNHVPSPSPPAPSSSKLSKFLPKASRDRSKSVNESASGSMSSPEYVSSAALALAAKRRSSKKEKSRNRESVDRLPPPQEEPPVIVEPVAIPRPRTRSERPVSETGHIGVSSAAPSQYSYGSVGSSSPSRVGDIPARLSGWFTHTFSNSSTDLSLPSLLSQSHQGYSSGYASSSPSPTRRIGGASALLTAAKHGKGHLDKAVRYLMDSDTTPDKCLDPIWLLGVQHPGYEPPPPPSAMPASGSGHNRRGSLDSRRARGSPSSVRSYDSTSAVEYSLSQSQPPSAGRPPGAFWPPVFYDDFVSKIWLTYRTQFPPIKDSRLADLYTDNGSSTGTNNSRQSATVKKWPWG